MTGSIPDPDPRIATTDRPDSPEHAGYSAIRDPVILLLLCVVLGALLAMVFDVTAAVETGDPGLPVFDSFESEGVLWT